MKGFKNMLKKTLLLIIIVSSSLLVHSSNQDVHVHGLANGSMIINDSEVIIEIRVPSLSVVGFEHAAISKEDQSLVDQAILSLKESDLFNFFKKSNWFRKETQLSSQLLNHSVMFIQPNQNSKEEKPDHNHHHGHSHHHHDEDNHDSDTNEHREFLITRHYQIKDAHKINKISTDFFSRIPAVEKLQLTIINHDQQMVRTLNHHQSSFTINDA